MPLRGALLVNLRNIRVALDVVADAQPVEVPPPSALTTSRCSSPTPPCSTSRRST